MNHIGLNSWSFYNCPDGSTFDETSQQCLIKVPISDTFDQFDFDETQFQKLANFFVTNPPTVNEQQLDKNLIEPSFIKKLFSEVGYSRRI